MFQVSRIKDIICFDPKVHLVKISLKSFQKISRQLSKNVRTIVKKNYLKSPDNFLKIVKVICKQVNKKIVQKVATKKSSPKSHPKNH